jgi:hypothetical protein
LTGQPLTLPPPGRGAGRPLFGGRSKRDDLRLRPLGAPREPCIRFVAGAGGILFSEALAAEGEVVFAKACELGLEGIVSKGAGSFYKSGKSRNWLKTVNPNFVRT